MCLSPRFVLMLLSYICTGCFKCPQICGGWVSARGVALSYLQDREREDWNSGLRHNLTHSTHAISLPFLSVRLQGQSRVHEWLSERPVCLLEILRGFENLRGLGWGGYEPKYLYCYLIVYFVTVSLSFRFENETLHLTTPGPGYGWLPYQDC